MINDFNEKGHPMVFSDASTNTDELKNKCRAAIFSLTRQHGGAERLAEACFMIAQSELENNWQQRAEAAEAKLAELEKQEPYGYVHKSIYESCGSCGLTNEHDKYHDSPSHIPLFTRPAPAIDLAELVPSEGFLEGTSDESMLTWQRGWDACRAAILRNIEEANK